MHEVGSSFFRDSVVIQKDAFVFWANSLYFFECKKVISDLLELYKSFISFTSIFVITDSFLISRKFKISKIKKGPLFVKFSKGSKLTNSRLSDQSVALIIKEYLLKAGLDSKNYSGHSLRSGFATSAAEAGAEERSIMAMTGHKSADMVRRYIKEANLFRNNALSKIKI